MKLSGGPSAVASVLNLTAPSLEKSLMDAIGARDPELASQIKGLMFVFEDLTLLDGRAMQRLLRDIEGKELALALKAASEELKQHILKNMSERAAAALQEEMEYLGPVKVKDVEAAHLRIIQAVRSLEEAGEIVVGGGGEGTMSSPEPSRFAAWPMPDLRRGPCRAGVSGGARPVLHRWKRHMHEGVDEGRRIAATGCRPTGFSAPARRSPARPSRCRPYGAAFAIEAEESLYALATALAHQIVQRELATDPTIVRDLVRRAIEVLPLEGPLEIRLESRGPRRARRRARPVRAGGAEARSAVGGRTDDRAGWLPDRDVPARGGRADRPGAQGDVRPAARWLARPTPRWYRPRSAAPRRCPGSRCTAG